MLKLFFTILISILLTSCNMTPRYQKVTPAYESNTGKLLTVYRGGSPSYSAKSKTLVLRDIDDLDMMLHELGHWYHDMHNSPPELDELILAGYKVKFIGITRGEDINKETRMLQDFYNGISRGRVRYKFGHNGSYWDNKVLVLKETYANLFCIWVRGYKNQKRLIERDFPALYYAYDSYFKDVTGYTLMTTGGAYYNETISSYID